MKKLLSAGILSLVLFAGSAFAFSGQYRNNDWDDHHRRHARVVRIFPDRDHHRRHARIIRMNNGRRIVVVRTPRHREHYIYYDRHVRMP